MVNKIKIAPHVLLLLSALDCTHGPNGLNNEKLCCRSSVKFIDLHTAVLVLSADDIAIYLFDSLYFSHKNENSIYWKMIPELNQIFFLCWKFQMTARATLKLRIFKYKIYNFVSHKVENYLEPHYSNDSALHQLLCYSMTLINHCPHFDVISGPHLLINRQQNVFKLFIHYDHKLKPIAVNH